MSEESKKPILEEPVQEVKQPAKGDLNGECYRSVCKNAPARWYNHSTRKHYCVECADLINVHNHSDAMRIYGHELCTLVKQEEQEET